MKKAFNFLIKLLEEVKKDDIIALANEMTYKGLLAMFPFIIFLMSLLGFFNIDGNYLLNEASYYLPSQAMSIIYTFVDEVIDQKNAALLSTSLLVSIFSASSGFKAVIRGINKSYGISEKRNFLLVTAISVLMVFVFALVIIVSLAVLIYGDIITTHLSVYVDASQFSWRLFNFLVYVIVLFIILCSVMLIYKVSCTRKITFRDSFPGSVVTVILWLIASEIFNIYVNTFSKHTKVYGSIGSVFILVIWINIIAVILLIGSEINALLEEPA